MNLPADPARKLFWYITGWRWPVLVISIGLIALSASFIPRLVKDTTADAFISPSNPALIYRDKVKETFGLKDPIVTAVVAEGSRGIYTPEALALLQWLTGEIQKLENIDPERVTSLATESHIVGTDDGMIVEDFFDPGGEHFTTPLDSMERAAQIRAAIDDFPLYQGSLVARDGSAAIIVAEMLDETQARETYERIEALLDKASIASGLKVHVAGEGAVAGLLSSYIDQDAARLNPLAGLIITIILAFTFFSLRGAILPNIIVVGTVAGSLGLMAASGVSFYVITNGLVVNLIGIAVADSIHIFSQYYEEQQARPEAQKRELVVRAMAAMWRPVTLTTLTTVAGFLALAVSAEMPPVKFFGLFGAIGVAAAWVYSMTLLPACMMLWPGRRLPLPFKPGRTAGSRDLPGRAMQWFGRLVLGNPRLVLALTAVVVLAGVTGASRIVTNDARIENFKSTEALYQADKAINAAMDGTYYLDVMVETAQTDDLHKPEYLDRIEALQSFMGGLPHVNGTTSLVDYVKQMHRAVNENRPEAYHIPRDGLLNSQLFFLYNASADPTDFQEEVDFDYQRALVRANVNVGSFLNNKQLIPALEDYLIREFNAEGITGTVTGRVNVDYHWLNGVEDNHAMSVALSLLAVTLMAMLVFRSVTGGLIALVPVAMAVLLVYAVMGFGEIWLGVGTSMFAAIAIGLGIDFAIHTIDRVRELTRRHGLGDDALLRLFPSTGRALLFNFIAVALGFGVLISSEVPPLIKFGALVAVAVATAFLSSMTVVPALVKLLRPAFLAPSPITKRS